MQKSLKINSPGTIAIVTIIIIQAYYIIKL